MALLQGLKPKFWDHTDVAAGPYRHLFNFRRIWKLAVLLMAVVCIVPLVVITLVDHNVTQEAIVSAIHTRTAQFVSNTWRTVFFFVSERRAALDIIIREHTYEELADQESLAAIFKNLKKVVGGFTDLGLIDSDGSQKTYEGPYDYLAGRNYSDQEWFREAAESGAHISDVFLGFRNVPHFVIAVKHEAPDGSFFILRAALDTKRFNELLSQLEISGRGDTFIINREGVLQTPSQFHGDVLDKIGLPVPAFSPKTLVYECDSPEGEPLIVGYAYIPETPFIQMVVKQMDELMEPWRETRLELFGFLAGSITVILLVIVGVATYLVSKIYVADQRRVNTLHHVEYANKMATIGRLAAGVAHEVNNPLAIINEKAGLIKDLFVLQERYARDDKLLGLVDSILQSVERCSAITKRLLGFSRQSEAEIKTVDLGELIREVLGFQGKEAEYRSLCVNVDAAAGVSRIESNPGKLQEIFLNLVNNAFAALDDGGRLDIAVRHGRGDDYVTVTVADNGCGISEEDQKRIFEPFFSTKQRTGGTGLGLSITQGLVEELGGCITVKSRVGEGTCFTVALPLKLVKRRGVNHASPVG